MGLQIARNAKTLEKIKQYWEGTDEQTWQYLDQDPRHLGGRIRKYWISWLLKKQVTHVCSSLFLDVGCAEGLFVHEMSQFKVFSVGLDISHKMIRKAKLNMLRCMSIPPFTDFCLGDISHLPFRDSVFDIVLCSETLEHTIDWRSSVKHLARLAKSLVISYPCYESPFSLLVRKIIKVFAKRDIFIEESIGHISVIRRRELEKLLMSLGLNLQERIASHTVFSFPSIPHATNLMTIIYRISPTFTFHFSQVVEKLDKKVDHRLAKFISPFAGSVIELWTRNTYKT